MATLTLSTSFNDDWPPDTLEGGTILTRTATAMTYTSDMGYTITLRGTGFSYDDDGLPSGGTVGRLTILKAGVTFADFTGVSTSFTFAGMKLFGYDRDNGNHEGPDPYGFVQNMLRGNDLIIGSAQDDDLRSGTGNDTINGGDGDDYVGAEAGDDVMNGGAERNTLSFDEANYRWDAFRGVNLDVVTGIAIDNWGDTDRFSNFGRFKDSLFSDTLRGSLAEESFVVSRGNDIIDGRGGIDTLDYSQVDRWGAHRGVNVNLATGVAIDSWGNTDTISNMEEVRGSVFKDTLTGSARDEYFIGGRGVDVINGGGGIDRLNFWDVGDNDIGHGIVINTSLAANVQDDGFGNTETALGIERFRGSRFNDRFTGGGGEDDFGGDDGNDTLIGGAGTDHLSGDDGDDRLTGNLGEDDFNFGNGLAEAGVDTITDMQVGIDEIWVTSDWGGLTTEFLIANQFRSGAGVTTANTATQRLIYNTTTGDLYYDADGVGGAAAVRFAVLSNQAAINFGDFHVFL